MVLSHQLLSFYAFDPAMERDLAQVFPSDFQSNKHGLVVTFAPSFFRGAFGTIPLGVAISRSGGYAPSRNVGASGLSVVARACLCADPCPESGPGSSPRDRYPRGGPLPPEGGSPSPLPSPVGRGCVPAPSTRPHPPGEPSSEGHRGRTAGLSTDSGGGFFHAAGSAKVEESLSIRRIPWTFGNDPCS